MQSLDLLQDALARHFAVRHAEILIGEEIVFVIDKRGCEHRFALEDPKNNGRIRALELENKQLRDARYQKNKNKIPLLEAE